MQTAPKAFFLFFLFLVLLVSACQNEPVVVTAEYTGPLSEVNNVEMLYSDSARLSVRVKTPTRLEMANGDQVFPKTVNIYFYDRAGRETTTLRSDSGRYFPNQNVYKVKGNVLLVNKVKNETLATDELTWEPNTKKIFTDKPVTLRRPTEQIKGLGLDTDQSFSNYKMRKVTGSIRVSGLP